MTQDEQQRKADLYLVESVGQELEAVMLRAVEHHLTLVAHGASPRLARRVVTYAATSLLGKLLIVSLEQDGESARPALRQMIDSLRLLVEPTPPTEH
jgi:hypothetical protein